MSLATILRQGWTALVLMLMLAATASAQRGRDDDGEYQILQARYGTSQHHVDVTQQLKQLARQDRRFKLVNDVFGVDPDPGRRKTLRIFARGRDGQQRTFEYEEYSQVDGAQFTGWGRGDWGHGGWSGGWGGGRDDGDEPQAGGARLRIISARYGYGSNTVDVSDRLRELVRRNRLELRVDNSLAGSDPAPGRRKTLTLTYAPEGGDIRQVRVNERDMLRVP